METTALPILFVGPSGFLGQEQANIQIHPQTTAAAYQRSQWAIVSRGWRAAGRKSVPTV